MWTCFVIAVLCSAFQTAARAASGRFNGTFEPVTSATGYDEDVARGLLYIASATYCEVLDHVLDWTCEPCVSSKIGLVPGKIRVMDFDIYNSTRVLVGKLKEQHGCIVAFRGTDNWYNVLRDLQYFRAKPEAFPACSGCLVHRGFYHIWKEASSHVLGALAEVGCKPHSADNQVYITGHSSGASVSHLAMFDLHSSGFDVKRTYSFEAARVGNHEFAEAFKAQFSRFFPVFRVTYAMDPVIHLPPRFAGFEHVQTEVFYNRTGQHKVCTEVEDPTCSGQFGDFVADWMHKGEHCKVPLLGGGNICWPKGCLNEPTKRSASLEVVV